MFGDKSSSSSTSSNESVIYKINDMQLSSSDHISNLRNKKLAIMCNALKSNKENSSREPTKMKDPPHHQSGIPLAINLKNIPPNIYQLTKQCSEINSHASTLNQQTKMVNGIDKVQERVKMVHGGYASDGEYHKDQKLDEIVSNLGYLSEGSCDNASQYARKMQERLKEGMLAVRECMQKTNAMLVDDECYDDTSSISSSELSDAINDMSTDDNQTMSSLSTLSSGMTYLKKAANKYQGIGEVGKSVYASKSLPACSKPRTQEEMQNFSTLTRRNPYFDRDMSQNDYRKVTGYTGAMLVEKSYQAKVVSDLCQKSYTPNNVGMAMENDPYGKAKMKDMETNTNMMAKVLLHHNSMSSKMASPLRIGLTIGRDYRSKHFAPSANMVRNESLFNRSLSTNTSDCVANEFMLAQQRPLSDDISVNLSLDNGELHRYKCLSDCENETKRRNGDAVDAETRKSLVSRTDSVSKKSASNTHEAFGSCLSLTSNNSSIYSNNEDKQSQEVRRLKRELETAQEKINTLTTQITTNAHVVSAFEQSLTNMTKRLKLLTNASQQKDLELKDLKSKVDELKKLQKGHFQHNKSRESGSSMEENLSNNSLHFNDSNDLQDFMNIDTKKKKVPTATLR